MAGHTQRHNLIHGTCQTSAMACKSIEGTPPSPAFTSTIALPLLTSFPSGHLHDRVACIHPHLPTLTYFSSQLPKCRVPDAYKIPRKELKNGSSDVAIGPIMRLFEMAGKVVAAVLVFAALSIESQGFVSAFDGGANGAAAALLGRVVKGAPGVRVRVIPVRMRSWFGNARERDTDAGEITTASFPNTANRHSIQKIRARRRLHAVSDGDCNVVAVATTSFRLTLPRRLGPASNVPRRPLTVVRPIKLFILCAHRRLRKVRTVGLSVASSSLSSPIRADPANQHLVPLGNNHRRALKQLQVPPLPFTLPPLPFSPPTTPQLRIPPLPFTLPPLPFSPPTTPQLRIPPLPPLPFTSTPALPSVFPKQVSLPPLPFQVPPLPFQIPPLPCLPSSSGRSLPAP